MATEHLRKSFLANRLFVPGQARFIYTDLDRIVLGGIVPDSEFRLPTYPELGAPHFTARREAGIVNLGGSGEVVVSGQRFVLDKLDCLYVGIGEEEVLFSRNCAAQPAFYLLSCPAHKKYPTAKVSRAESQFMALGDDAHASRRRIHKYIHPDGIRSCQLVMGLTEIEPNCVWNTMSPHTHSRRTEVYLYCDLGDEVVVHLMGRPDRTRSLIVRDREAVLSPAWSIHAAAGTSNYKFIWGMAGENQDFADVDPVGLADLH
jgi:4-deoxy-L-threo-5-hexosulose-uronate ketol-isomerase